MFLRQYVPLSAYKPRLYLNGFPKSGIHLLKQMVEPLLTPSSVGRDGTSWCGTFKYHSWTNEWLPIRQTLWRFSCLPRGEFLMGHCGYHPDIEKLFWCANIGHIFLYRDPRAVAVSQTHHILDDRPGLMHQHKDFYQMLGSFKAALGAVIGGIGPYPGVMSRWSQYAAWLDSDFILKLRFEDLIKQPEICAQQIIDFAVKNATELLEGTCGKIECTPETHQELVKLMVKGGKDTAGSTTFREGKVDGWKKDFDDDVRQLFKRHDPDNRVVKLGYEKNEDW